MRLEHIEKRYGTGAAVLSDISLTLEAGGFYFLTGASGAGKTMLLNIMFAAEPPTAGRLVVFGDEAGQLDRAGRAALRRRIGFVFSDLRLVEDWSAADNVALPLRIAGAAEREIARNVSELLTWIGLAERKDQPAATLPASVRQRIAIARAIVGRPQLLLADEPTGAADEEAALFLVRVFERVNRLGTTVLIATRDLAFARGFAHVNFHLENGRLSAAPASTA